MGGSFMEPRDHYVSVPRLNVTVNERFVYDFTMILEGEY